jgi:lipoprotein-anchoring transpeptidase ErfK/SrfK
MHSDQNLLAVRLSRRACLRGMGASVAYGSLLAGCSDATVASNALPRTFSVTRDYASEAHQIMRVRRSKFEDRLHPHIVETPFRYASGTLIVDNTNNYIYLQHGDGTARRYGVGVGRRGLAWSGTARIAIKREWPAWNPTPRMRAQEPTLPAYVAPGTHNPLGARALYLFRNGEDTLYRIHGTSEPWTIGTRASSGCIRMLNEDIVDLYERVALNSTVIVL